MSHHQNFNFLHVHNTSIYSYIDKYSFIPFQNETFFFFWFKISENDFDKKEEENKQNDKIYLR